jgi:hypothetical protein
VYGTSTAAACFSGLGNSEEDESEPECAIKTMLSTISAATLVRVSMYQWDIEANGTSPLNVTDYLLAAKDIATAHVILEDKVANNDFVTALQNAPFAPYDAGVNGSYYHLCYDGCAAPGEGNQHTKMFLFNNHPQVGESTSEDAFIITSSNMTTNARGNSQNLVLIVDNDETGSLFQWLRQHWTNLLQGDWPTSDGTEYWSSSSRVYGAFWTRGTPNSPPFDPWERITDEIVCNTYTEEVLVIMSDWNPNGRPALAQNLDAFAANGCTVKVVVQDEGVKNTLESDYNNIPNANIKYADGSQSGGGKVHDKLLLVDATYKTVGDKRIFTGSHIATTDSLNADEVIVSIGDSTLATSMYADYKEHFDAVFAAAAN